MALGVCKGCGRHVRESDAACPFCGGVGMDMPVRKRRASRAAIFGAAAVALACGGTTQPTSDGGDGDGAAGDGAQPADAADEGMVTFYGGPPLDASPPPNDASTDADDATTALYGAPPPADGG